MYAVVLKDRGLGRAGCEVVGPYPSDQALHEANQGKIIEAIIRHRDNAELVRKMIEAQAWKFQGQEFPPVSHTIAGQPRLEQ